MKKFLFLYKGYMTPTAEIGKAWMDWFASVGDAMVDSGNAMSAGVEVTPDAVTPIETGLDSFTGYSIINAESMDDAVALAKTNPMITSVVYDLSRM
jgi:hypothetical protein